ncbi:MAG: hypothetical protein JXA33_22975 [Anaerolineae bacterium]|nr:hypothetical protein [Anaerolineae bacterium]
MRIAGRLYSLIVTGFIALVFMGCGLFLILGFGRQESQEARRLANIARPTAAEFGRMATGAEVAVTGALDGKAINDQKDLILFEHQKWDVEYDSDDGYEGDWETVIQQIPAFEVVLADGRVGTEAVEQVKLGGMWHEVAIEYSDSTLKADGIPDGSERIIGYLRGDLVTVVGQKGNEGRVVPERIFGGDHEALVKNVRMGAWLLSGIGTLFVIIAPLIFLGTLFGRGGARVRFG